MNTAKHGCTGHQLNLLVHYILHRHLQNTHVYHMYTSIFQLTACYHLNTIAKLHKSHIVIIGSR